MSNFSEYHTVEPFNQFSADFQNYVKENGIKIYSDERKN